MAWTVLDSRGAVRQVGQGWLRYSQVWIVEVRQVWIGKDGMLRRDDVS